MEGKRHDCTTNQATQAITTPKVFDCKDSFRYPISNAGSWATSSHTLQQEPASGFCLYCASSPPFLVIRRAYIEPVETGRLV